MLFKHGVKFEGLSPQMWFALGFIECEHRLIANDEVVITSLLDSDPNRLTTSLHPSGKAADIRTKYLNEDQKQALFVRLKNQLSPKGFDVVRRLVGTEIEHIHIEYDPKGRQLFRWSD